MKVYLLIDQITELIDKANINLVQEWHVSCFNINYISL